MNLKEIEASELIKGTRDLPRGPFILESYETRSNYWIDRIVLRDSKGNRLVIRGDSLKVLEMIKSAPIKKWAVKSNFKGMISGEKVFDTKEEAEGLMSTLGLDWECKLEEIEVLPVMKPIPFIPEDLPF